MVEFQAQDYLEIRLALLEKLNGGQYFSGHVSGRTSSGIRYRLVCTIIHFISEDRVVPVWWEMLTYDEYGDKMKNDFSFRGINWF